VSLDYAGSNLSYSPSVTKIFVMEKIIVLQENGLEYDENSEDIAIDFEIQIPHNEKRSYKCEYSESYYAQSLDCSSLSSNGKLDYALSWNGWLEIYICNQFGSNGNVTFDYFQV
jgi:hypothetical protein